MTDTLVDRAIAVRIRAEYLEMPGLRLTVSQAARLFNLELAYCGRLLDASCKRVCSGPTDASSCPRALVAGVRNFLDIHVEPQS